MGCAGSKATEVAAADVYRPPPTSIALFDISAVEEPWLITKTKLQDQQEPEEDTKKHKPTPLVPLPLLEKLDSYELAPTSWSEVSKALEDLKPTLTAFKSTQPPSNNTTTAATNSIPTQHDIEPGSLNKPPPPELTGRRPVKENPFILNDKENKKKDSSALAAAIKLRRRDPLEKYPERRPPGTGGGGVVLYTTTLRGVRRTFEDCEGARQVLEAHAVEAGVAVDERDVSLHGEYLKELRELLAGGDVAVAAPRLFVMGRYVGGVEEVVELAETGKLREIMRWAAARGEGGKDGKGCEGCGGARFLPCWECGGSCKVVVVVEGVAEVEEGERRVERCGLCNENGLALCPLCH